ncbi:MAG: alpha/beta hydrolase [Flavobacteriales bacterium]|nr:alpha/beta hydrolase [Flavobacteriales bacterium]
MKKHIYILSGLGADHRAFQRIDFKEFNHTFIQWVAPNRDETLSQYAQRIAKQLTEENPIIIGLSFGGMVAVEIAKPIPTAQLILISSAKTKHEIPKFYRLLGKLKLHKLLPVTLLKKSNPMTNWFFGVKTIHDKQILADILYDTNPIFLKWAMNAVMIWQNEIIPPNVVHIHGSHDKILPIRCVNATEIIPGGGHLMVLSNHKNLNKVNTSMLNLFS